MSTSGLSAASDIRVVKIVQASDIVGVEELVGRLGVVALVVSLLAMILSCGPPTTGYFANLEFSPDLHLIPSHPLSPEPHVGSFYFVFHTGTGLTEVDHLRQDGPATPPTVLLFLEMNRDHMLDRTVKSIQLMKGRFGTVYAERTCFFNRPPETRLEQCVCPFVFQFRQQRGTVGAVSSSRHAAAAHVIESRPNLQSFS